MIPDELKMSYNSVESLLSADASTATKLLYSVFAVVTVVKKWLTFKSTMNRVQVCLGMVVIGS